ncbi:hypothetical protein HYY72_02070 [Candidatus Woesearchaeota archaeon]|nr:hypothetical protein [Candidatus Woesearchaeota archaeon]
MGIFGKLMFWKKKDDLGLGDNLGLPANQPQPFQPGNYPGDVIQQPWSQPQSQGLYAQNQTAQFESLQSSSSYAAGKQLEVVSAKLDALKAAIDSLSQRMANIERMMESEEYFKKRGW